ncbi:hypothetical protein [Legionella sp. WA2022007384]
MDLIMTGRTQPTLKEFQQCLDFLNRARKQRKIIQINFTIGFFVSLGALYLGLYEPFMNYTSQKFDKREKKYREELENMELRIQQLNAEISDLDDVIKRNLHKILQGFTKQQSRTTEEINTHYSSLFFDKKISYEESDNGIAQQRRQFVWGDHPNRIFMDMAEVEQSVKKEDYSFALFDGRYEIRRQRCDNNRLMNKYNSLGMLALIIISLFLFYSFCAAIKNTIKFPYSENCTRSLQYIATHLGFKMPIQYIKEEEFIKALEEKIKILTAIEPDVENQITNEHFI